MPHPFYPSILGAAAFTIVPLALMCCHLVCTDTGIRNGETVHRPRTRHTILRCAWGGCATSRPYSNCKRRLPSFAEESTKIHRFLCEFKASEQSVLLFINKFLRLLLSVWHGFLVWGCSVELHVWGMLLGDVITLLIHISVLSIRGLVVTESGGTLFQQIFF